MRITIEPTPARDMKPGDRFRDNGQSVQVTDLEIDEKDVKIIYAFEGERLVNSTFVTPLTSAPATSSHCRAATTN